MVSVTPPTPAVMDCTVIGVPAVYGPVDSEMAYEGVAVVVDVDAAADCQLSSSATTEYWYVVAGLRPLSWHDVTDAATVHTVVGLPGPLVRVTR